MNVTNIEKHRGVLTTKKYVALAVSVVAILVFVIGVTHTSAITAQLNDWKLLPQPERLSELYFQNHATLPTTYSAGTAQSFAFTTHNLEYRDTTYTYRIVEQSEDASQSHELASGQFSLAQDAYRTTTIMASPVDLGGRVQLQVNLTVVGNPTTMQSIHYWVRAVPS